jgi:hypothetical protein
VLPPTGGNTDRGPGSTSLQRQRPSARAARRGGELHENGGALDDVRVCLAEEGEDFAFRGRIRRPMVLLPTVPAYAAPLRKEVARPQRAITGKGEYLLLSTLNV